MIVQEMVSPRKSRGAALANDVDILYLNGHFSNTQCLSCGEAASQCEDFLKSDSTMVDPEDSDLCDECCLASEETLANLESRIRTRQERVKNAHRVCVSCTNITASEPIHCESLDCQWFYTRRKAEARMELVPLLAEVSRDLEDAIEEIEDDESGDAVTGFDFYDQQLEPQYIDVDYNHQ